MMDGREFYLEDIFRFRFKLLIVDILRDVSGLMRCIFLNSCVRTDVPR